MQNAWRPTGIVVYTDINLAETAAAADRSPGSLALALDVSKPDHQIAEAIAGSIPSSAG